MEDTPKVQMKNTDFTKWLNPLAIFVTLIVVVAYFGVVLKFAVNIPYWDEYVITLGFLEKWNTVNGFSEAWSLIYNQVNEHRIVIYQLLLVVEQWIWGNVDFIRMIIFGNIGILIMWWILWKSFDCPKNKFFYFLPITFLLFVPAWERSQWGCSSFFNTYVNVFAFITFYFLQKEEKQYFALAVIFSILSIYTFGNGILTYPIGGLLLYINGQSRKRLILWVGISVIALGLFFIGYHRSQNAPISLSLLSPILFGAFYFSYIGAIFKYFSTFLAPFAGLGIIVGYIVCFWNQRNNLKKESLLWSYAIFIISTIGLASANRFGFGLGAALAARYELLHLLVLVLLYMLFFHYYREATLLHFFSVLISVIFLYGARMHKNYLECENLKERLETGLMLYHGGNPLYLYTPEKQRNAALLQKVEKNGLYNSPKERLWQLPSGKKMDYSTFNTKEELTIQVELEDDNPNSYFIKGWAIVKNKPTFESQIWLTLKSTDNNIVWAYLTIPIKRPNLTQQYGFGFYIDNAGFRIMLPKDQLELPKGDYELGLLQQKGEAKVYKKLKNLRI